MKTLNRAIAAGLSASLLLGAIAPVAYADPKAELAEAQKRLEELGGELGTLQDELAEQSEQLEMTSYKIGEKQAQIDKTNEDLSEARSILGGRMRSSYKSGTSSLVQLLLGSTSIEDVISRIYYMDKVAQSDAAAINEVKALEEQLSSEQADLKETEATQEKAVVDLQEQVNIYDEKVLEAQQYYDSLDAQVQQQLAQEAENARIQAALEAAAREEAERKAAEEAARAQEEAESAQTTTETTQTTDTTETTDTSSDDQSSTPTPSSTSYGPSGGGLSTAYSCIGCPYVYGATGPGSFDCSGLVCYCYGFARGRTTYDMIASLQSTGSWKTSIDQLVPGDLVFTHSGHVGIYVGGHQMIHAPSPGRSVCQADVYAFIGGGTY